MTDFRKLDKKIDVFLFLLGLIALIIFLNYQL